MFDVVPAVENFTTWVESDPSSKLVVTSTTVASTMTNDLDNTYIYKDYGVNYFDNVFYVDAEIKITDASLEYGQSPFLAFANSFGDVQAVSELTYCFAYRSGGTGHPYSIYLQDNISGSAGTIVVLSGVTYYCRVTRSGANGSVWNLSAYTNSARTNLYAGVTVTNCNTDAFRYLMAFSSNDDGSSAQYVYMNLSNLTVTNKPDPVTGSNLDALHPTAIGEYTRLNASWTNDASNYTAVSYFAANYTPTDMYASDAYVVAPGTNYFMPDTVFHSDSNYTFRLTRTISDATQSVIRSLEDGVLRPWTDADMPDSNITLDSTGQVNGTYSEKLVGDYKTVYRWVENLNFTPSSVSITVKINETQDASTGLVLRLVPIGNAATWYYLGDIAFYKNGSVAMISAVPWQWYPTKWEPNIIYNITFYFDYPTRWTNISWNNTWANFSFAGLGGTNTGVRGGYIIYDCASPIYIDDWTEAEFTQPESDAVTVSAWTQSHCGVQETGVLSTNQTAYNISWLSPGEYTLSGTWGQYSYDRMVIKQSNTAYPTNITGTEIANISRFDFIAGSTAYHVATLDLAYPADYYTLSGYSSHYNNYSAFNRTLTTTRPVVTTNSSTGVEENNVTLNGYLTYNNSQNCIVRFQYGPTTNYGTNSTNQSLTSTNGFSYNLSGLTPGTLYHYRTYANSTTRFTNGSDTKVLTKPEGASSFTSTATTSSSIYLTWTKGTGANNTYIERNTIPTWTKGTGTIVYNNTGTNYNNTGLTPGTLYYYTIWSYSQWDELNQFSDNSTTKYDLTFPNPPNTQTYSLNSTLITIGWIKGTGSNNTVLVYSETGQPTTPSEGTLLYNGTGTSTTFNYTSGTSYYFSGFGYVNWTGPTTYKFSSDYLAFDIGGLFINCYDEINFTNLTFNVKISNPDGSEVYEADGCTNTYSINESLCPNGEDIQVIVSATGYQQRSYTLDIYEGLFYLLNTYLPEIEGSGGAGGSGDLSDCTLRTYTDSKTITNPAIDNTITFSYPLDNIINVEIYNSSLYPTTLQTLAYTDSAMISNYSNDTTITHTHTLTEIISVELYNQSLYGTYGGWIFVPNSKYTYNETRTIVNKTIQDSNTTMLRVNYYYEGYTAQTGGWIFVPADKYTNTTSSLTISSSAMDSNTIMARVNYYYYYCPGETLSFLYNIRVVETITTSSASWDKPVENALFEIKKYVNITGQYTLITSLYTDANGYINIYLIPGTNYKVFVSKTGYNDTISNYIPEPPDQYGNVDEKTFRLTKIIETPDENITILLEDVKIIKYNATIFIFYYLNLNNNSTFANFTVYDGDLAIYSYNESVTPNNKSIYFTYTTFSLSNDILRLVVVATKTDGSIASFTRYFNIYQYSGGGDISSAPVMAIISLAICFFGLTLTHPKSILGAVGIIVLIIALAFTAFADQSVWYIHLVQAIELILLLYVLLIFKEEGTNAV